MKPNILFSLSLSLAWASFLTCSAESGERPASLAELKALVKDYAFRNKPKLRADTQFEIEEYTIDGLKSLKVQVFLVRYLTPDGSRFNEALLSYHDGKIAPVAPILGGHGLMSAVVSDGKLYYTYSWGSGRHRSHLAQLSIVGSKLVIAESGPLMDQDCFVKQDGARLRLEKGKFKKLNLWKADGNIGEIIAKESGFAVRDAAGKEIELFVGQAIQEQSNKK